MVVLIDATGCISDSRQRGIGRYSRKFISRVISEAKAWDVHVLINYVDSRAAKSYLRELRSKIGPENIHFWSSSCQREDPFDCNSGDYKLVEEVYQAILLELRPNVMIFTEPFNYKISATDLSEYGIACYGFVYDLIPILFPNDYLADPRHRNWYEFKMKSMRKMDGLLTISETSRNDIVDRIGHSNVVDIGCDTANDLHLINDVYKTINGISVENCHYVLYTGGFDSRKNIDFLIEAFSKFLTGVFKGYKLYIVGYSPNLEKFRLLNLCKNLKCDQSVEFLGFVTDSQLSFLYRNCSVFVNPSSYEGFGLPVLEAMRCSAPVLVANNSNLSELVSSEHGKFRTNDTADFLKKLENICSNEQLRRSLIADGLRDSERYNWNDIVSRFIGTIEKDMQGKLVTNTTPQPTMALIDSIKSRQLSEHQLVQLAKALNKSEIIFKRKPRIYVDVSILIQVDSGTGIQRVVRAISSELLEICPTDKELIPIYFCRHKSGFLAASVDRSMDSGDVSYRPNPKPLPVDFFQRDIFLGLDLNHDWVVNNNEHFDEIVNSPAKAYFVVYDLLPVKHPQLFDPIHNLTDLHHSWLMEISKADGILAISKTVSEQYEKYIRDNTGNYLPEYFKIGSFLLGSNIVDVRSGAYSKEETKNFSQIDKAEINLLIVGTIEPRKGHEDVLNAFDILWRDNKNTGLIFAGRLGWNMSSFSDRISKHPEFGKKLFWFESINDQDLNELYEIAHGVIAASVDEGFGLPIVEASMRGTPVLARDIPVFREVGGDGVRYFPGRVGTDELAIILSKWVEDLKAGRVRNPDSVQCITWHESAKQVLDFVLEKI